MMLDVIEVDELQTDFSCHPTLDRAPRSEVIAAKMGAYQVYAGIDALITLIVLGGAF